MHLGCIPQLSVPFPKPVDEVASIGLTHACVGQRAVGDLTAGQVLAECRRAGVGLSAMWARPGAIKPGPVMATKALLAEPERPTDEQIRERLSGTICRCGSYRAIVDAVKRAGASTP